MAPTAAAAARDSISTASDLTLDDLDVEQGQVYMSNENEGETIPLGTFSSGPIPGLRRIVPQPINTRRILCFSFDQRGVFIMVSVVLGMVLFILLIPWLAGSSVSRIQIAPASQSNGSSKVSNALPANANTPSPSRALFAMVTSLPPVQTSVKVSHA